MVANRVVILSLLVIGLGPAACATSSSYRSGGTASLLDDMNARMAAHNGIIYFDEHLETGVFDVKMTSDSVSWIPHRRGMRVYASLDDVRAIYVERGSRIASFAGLAVGFSLGIALEKIGWRNAYVFTAPVGSTIGMLFQHRRELVYRAPSP